MYSQVHSIEKHRGSALSVMNILLRRSGPATYKRTCTLISRLPFARVQILQVMTFEPYATYHRDLMVIIAIIVIFSKHKF